MKHNYKFTEHWFDGMIPNWEIIFKHYTKPINRVLEIGCYEGRATTWLCENVLNDNIIFDVIDTFVGPVNESGGTKTINKLKEEVNFIENNFNHNISFFTNISFNVYKDFSQKVLPTFDDIPIYDFIYIDASHRSDDTFVDAYYAHKLLKSGGLLIFDDYRWKDNNDMRRVNSPELAIDMFYIMYKELYNILFKGYQIGFIKK